MLRYNAIKGAYSDEEALARVSGTCRVRNGLAGYWPIHRHNYKEIAESNIALLLTKLDFQILMHDGSVRK